MNNFTKNTLNTVLINVLILFIGIVPSVIIARVLGPEAKGIYSLAILFVSFLIAFTSFGFCSSINYYTAKKSFPLNEIFGNTFIISLAISVFSMLIGATFIFIFSARFIPGVSPFYLYLSLLFVPFYVIFFNLGHIFVGLQKIYYYNIISIIRACFDVAFIFALVYIFRLNVTGAIAGNIFSALVSSIVIILWLSRMIGKISVNISRVFIKKNFGYGIKAYLNSIINILSYKIDIFLINWFLGPLAVGFYASAAALAGRLWIVSNAATIVLFPNIAAEKDEARRKRFTPIVCRTCIFITALMVSIFYITSSKLIIILYSPVFIPTIRPFQILLFGVIALVTWHVLSGDLSGRGRPELNTYVYAISVVINIVLNIFMIPRYGIIGAAWASVFSYTAASIGALYVYCRITNNSWTKVILLQKGDFKTYANVINNFWRKK